ncbi:MAG: hypothetical protein DRN14_07270 [Thermoplasmata archaeon]|nr:MAG: hypothetical protein DRN14_07270 [Thermoplasmata archaeon]
MIAALWGEEIVSVSAGMEFSLAITDEGRVFAWGSNSCGQLGDGTFDDHHLPQLVRLSGGEAYFDGVVMVSAGGEFALALKSDGTVWAWGRNDYGQLGTGDTTARTFPAQVRDSSGSGYLSGIVAISAGANHSLALDSSGTVWAWGANWEGGLGIGSADHNPHPLLVRVKDSTGAGVLSAVAQIVAGASFSLALDSAGFVWAWGSNYNGQLGNDTILPQYLPRRVKDSLGTGALSDVMLIGACGVGTYYLSGHALAVAADGTVWGWGRNLYGQLGDGTTDQRELPVRVHGIEDAGFLSGVVAIFGGMEHSLALLQDGRVLCWGDNSFGQLGDGTFFSKSYPVEVAGVDGVGVLDSVVAVSTAHNHNLAILSDGKVVAWGNNNRGQLGDGTTTDREYPVAITFAPLVVRQTPKSDRIDVVISPNPFNSVCRIELPDGVSAEICDISGRQVAAFSGKFVWRPDNLPAGVYLLKDGTCSGFARKIIYLK